MKDDNSKIIREVPEEVPMEDYGISMGHGFYNLEEESLEIDSSSLIEMDVVLTYLRKSETIVKEETTIEFEPSEKIKDFIFLIPEIYREEYLGDLTEMIYDLEEQGYKGWRLKTKIFVEILMMIYSVRKEFINSLKGKIKFSISNNVKKYLANYSELKGFIRLFPVWFFSILLSCVSIFVFMVVFGIVSTSVAVIITSIVIFVLFNIIIYFLKATSADVISQIISKIGSENQKK